MSQSKSSIAVVGASRDRRKFGNKAVRAYAAENYDVFPVHPHSEEIEGWPAFPSIQAIPHAVDRVSLYLPPHKTLLVLDQLAATKAKDIWLNPGSADAKVFKRAKELGLPVIDGCSIVDIGRTPSQFP